LTSNIEQIVVLLLVAALVAMLARRMGVPYTVGLVVAGILIAISPLHVSLHLTKDLIFTIFLPPLIYEAAFQMDWDELRHDLGILLILATVGVFISSAIVAVGARAWIGLGWSSAILLGVLLSATDPVSVIATFKESGVFGRIRMLVEAESLMNDGTAAVLFTLALGFAGSVSHSSPTAFGVILAFLSSVIGGIVVGAVVGGAALLLAGRATTLLAKMAFTMIAAYGAFILAQQVGFSGVLATMTAGILMGNARGYWALADQSGDELTFVWEFAAFLANSFIFLLIGIELAGISFATVWIQALIVIGLVLVGRAITVYGLCGLFVKSSLKVSVPDQHVLFWGGLRGALALALVLGLPTDMPSRSSMIGIVFAVVAFSVVFQGLTLKPLLRATGHLGRSR
jgi:CPA1 family monovalent cation:H+ antiporter